MFTFKQVHQHSRAGEQQVLTLEERIEPELFLLLLLLYFDIEVLHFKDKPKFHLLD